MGLRSRSQFPRPPEPACRGGGGGRQRAAHAGTARSRPLLSGARPDPGSQRRPRCGGNGRAGRSGRHAAVLARHRQRHDGPWRRRHEGPVAGLRRGAKGGNAVAGRGAGGAEAPRVVFPPPSPPPATQPLELQRYAFTEAVRAAVEVHDYGAAQSLLNEFDTLGPAPQRDADLTLLKGRIMEGLGRLSEALTFYRTVAESPERPAAARARLREIALQQSIGEMKRDEAAGALESL